jgi:tetratricopeptide (TPR) repeat protein
MAYFSCQGCRRAQAYVWQSRAANPDLLVLKRADLLRKAFAFEPSDFEITYQIAEFYRIQSFQGIQGYDLQAQTAMQWYSRGMKLDPFDGYNYLGYGMCLDWLERHDEAAPYFSRAEALDPNGYFTVAYLGWHYVQTGDYAAARACLQRSLWLQWNDNDIAHSYRDIVQDKLAQDASGQSRLPPGF